MATPLRNRLLVEGIKDLRVIPEIVEKLTGKPWGEWNERHLWPAEIVEAGGDSKLLQVSYISHQLKTSGVVNVGVIADADFGAAARWIEVRNLLAKVLPSLPAAIPAEGLIHEYDEDGPRKFGVWIMPDNQAKGMLETFLASCVPDQSQGLWPFVVKHCDEAKLQHLALYKDVHRDKATIHAWLALQNEPGSQLHDAIKFEQLKPGSPIAALFLAWFRKLFVV